MLPQIEDELWWTEQRRDLVRWFEDRAPSFVEGYRGAVWLLHAPTIPGRIHFVCHVVRDIYRKLPKVLGHESLPRPGEVFPAMVRDLRSKWEQFPPSTARTGEVLATEMRLAPQVYRCVESIVRKSQDMHKQPTVGHQLAIALYRSRDHSADAFIDPWITKSFDSEYGFFVSRAHLAESSEKVPIDDGLMEHFESFERAFHSLVGPYFSGKGELDVILHDTNPTAD